jgi:hypothetical protein
MKVTFVCNHKTTKPQTHLLSTCIYEYIKLDYIFFCFLFVVVDILVINCINGKYCAGLVYYMK